MASLDDTPAGIIARLDDALRRRGQTIFFFRYSGTPRVKSSEIVAMAEVRPVKSEDFVGEIPQDASTVIVSPSGLGPMSDLSKGDKARINGRERNIEATRPIYSGDVLVRIILMVLG